MNKGDNLEVSFSVEEEKRIALSYILSKKIMERHENFDIGIRIKPYYYCEELVISNYYGVCNNEYFDSYINYIMLS